VDVTYDVGSRVEPPGQTGFAHLFEHLMFEGSENVGKGEHFRLVAEAGGQMNGTTSEDRTNYYETLPREALDLGLFLEADRMRALVLTQEKLDNQREAVKEEKRLRVDNQPYASSFEATDLLAYDAFPYRHSVIGSMDDLGAATRRRPPLYSQYTPGQCAPRDCGRRRAEHAFARLARTSASRRAAPPPFKVEDEIPSGPGTREGPARGPARDHVNFKVRAPAPISRALHRARTHGRQAEDSGGAS
jgi:hypothetical protein